jgi:hypothetical protein
LSHADVGDCVDVAKSRHSRMSMASDAVRYI